METSLYSIIRLFVLVVFRRRLRESQLRESNSLNCKKVMQLHNRYPWLPSNASQLCLRRKVFFQKGKSVRVSPFNVNRMKTFGADDNNMEVTNSRKEVTFVECHCECRPLPALSYLILTITLWNRYCFPHFFRWGQRPREVKKCAQDNSKWQSWLRKRCPWIQRPHSTVPCSKCPEETVKMSWKYLIDVPDL